LASKELGVPEEEIEFEILEQPKKSLFGFKGEARVKAIFSAPENKAEEPVGETAETSEISETAEEAETAEAAEEETEAEGGELPEDFDVANSKKVKTAIAYLTDIFHALKLDNFQITPIKRDGTVVLDISGEKLAVIIGKRGETLDSLQYLAILASNRAEEESCCRISLDCNGYRSKRRETLENLARRTSAKVIKQGRKIALDPMNPYERRVIHSCVAEIEGVSSHSTGTEPYRRVVIYADKPKFDNNRRRGNRDRQGGSSSRSTRNYKQSSGFSTSFEREYKRKTYTPDDNADVGEFSKETVDTEKSAALYGKIEL
jgi:spoIIIJ-associated protein